MNWGSLLMRGERCSSSFVTAMASVIGLYFTLLSDTILHWLGFDRNQVFGGNMIAVACDNHGHLCMYLYTAFQRSYFSDVNLGWNEVIQVSICLRTSFYNTLPSYQQKDTCRGVCDGDNLYCFFDMFLYLSLFSSPSDSFRPCTLTCGHILVFSAVVDTLW